MAKKEKGKLWVRVMAWVLAGLMVVSMAYFTVYMIVDNVRNNETTEQT